MKIGIVTFFCVPNYGAMLQAYALWKYLEGRGHEVEFIDCAFGNTRRIPLWKCFVARHLHNCIDTIRKKLKLYVRFDIVHFSDAYPRTKRFKVIADLEIISNKYNAIIVGSDQMWNPAWCAGQYLPIVMLDFAGEGVKRMAYAASFGTTEWPHKHDAELAGKLLRKFDGISVREESGVEFVHRLSGRDDAKWHLDPTLLPEAQFYTALMSNLKNSKQRYIFSYILDEWADDNDIVNVIEAVKSARGVDSVLTDRIDVRGVLAPVCKLLKVQKKVSVSEWLSLIANADFVITNSFHGTVFSLLFHKPFVTFPVKGILSGMNERLQSLLRLVHLEKRLVTVEWDESMFRNMAIEVIDWEAVDTILCSKRKEAENYFFTNGL